MRAIVHRPLPVPTVRLASPVRSGIRYFVALRHLRLSGHNYPTSGVHTQVSQRTNSLGMYLSLRSAIIIRPSVIPSKLLRVGRDFQAVAQSKELTIRP